MARATPLTRSTTLPTNKTRGSSLLLNRISAAWETGDGPLSITQTQIKFQRMASSKSQASGVSIRNGMWLTELGVPRAEFRCTRPRPRQFLR